MESDRSKDTSLPPSPEDRTPRQTRRGFLTRRLKQTTALALAVGAVGGLGLAAKCAIDRSGSEGNQWSDDQVLRIRSDSNFRDRILEAEAWAKSPHEVVPLKFITNRSESGANTRVDIPVGSVQLEKVTLPGGLIWRVMLNEKVLKLADSFSELGVSYTKRYSDERRFYSVYIDGAKWSYLQVIDLINFSNQGTMGGQLGIAFFINEGGISSPNPYANVIDVPTGVRSYPLTEVDFNFVRVIGRIGNQDPSGRLQPILEQESRLYISAYLPYSYS